MVFFSKLPQELQLEILNHCDARSLTAMLKTGQISRAGSSYVLTKKLNKILGLNSYEQHKDDDDEEDFESESKPEQVQEQEHDSDDSSVTSPFLYISLYSPQQVNKKKGFYETRCASNASSEDISQSVSRNESIIELEKEQSTSHQQSPSNHTFIDNVIDRLKDLEANPSDCNNSRVKSNISLPATPSAVEEENHVSIFQAKTSTNKSDSLYTSIQLGKLKGLKDPLKVSEKPIFLEESEGDHDNSMNTQNESLNILIDEESSNFKIHFEILYKSIDPETKTEKLTKLSAESKRIFIHDKDNQDFQFGTITSDNNAISVSYKLTKGQVKPPMGPYDFNIMTNYYIQFESFQINSTYLLNRFEEAML